MGKVVGIDLGATTMSSAVVVHPGGAHGAVSPIPDESGGRAMPAVVALTAAGESVCGQAAKRLAAKKPELLVTAPSEATPALLARARKNAVAFLGDDVDGAVLTMAASASAADAHALEAAARRAGLAVRAVLPSPLAAVIAMASGRDELLAVYDLGGRTFSCSVVETKGGDARTVATVGERIGGADFDARVASSIAERVQREHGVDLLADLAAARRLREAAEAVRQELSSWIEAEVSLPFIALRKDGEPLHVQLTMTRAEMEMATGDLVERTVAASLRALREARIEARALDGIIVAGGMGRAAAVRRAAAELFGVEPREGFLPDEVVAAGAAMHAAELSGQSSRSGPASMRPSFRPSVAPVAISLACGEGGIAVLVPKGAKLPAERSLIFTTAVDDQGFVPLHVVAGDHPHAADNRTILRFELTGIAPSPRGEPRFTVAARVTFDGTVEIEIVDEDSGRGRVERVKRAFGDGFTREEDEASALVRDAPSASLEELRANANALLFLVEEATPGCANAVHPELVSHAAAAALELRAALETARTQEALRGAYDRLDSLALTIGRSLIEQTRRG